VVSVHAVLLFEMADDGLDSRSPSEGALDGGGQAALLAGDIDLEGLVLRRVVAAISGIGDDPESGWCRCWPRSRG
jgi:hypothetical protein